MPKRLILLLVAVFAFRAGPAQAQDTLRPLIAMLQNGDDAEKLMAVADIAELGPRAAPAVPALVLAMQSNNDQLRLKAAFALSEIGAPAVKPVGQLLASANPTDRFYSLWTLALLGPAARETSPIVIKALSDNNNEVRRKAAYALGRIAPDPKVAIGPLIPLLSDFNGEVRTSAADALGRLGAQAVPALSVALKHDESDVRAAAALALGRIGSDAKDAIPNLKECLLTGKGASPVAASALAKIGKASIPALADCLKYEDAGVRRLAVQTLGAIGPESMPALVAALAHKNSDVREEAAAALGPWRISDKKVVDALARGIDDPDRGVRGKCVLALAHLGAGAKPAVPKLIAALAAPNKPPRDLIFLVLERVGQAEGLLPVAVDLLDDHDKRVRHSGIRILGNQGEMALPHLFAALKDRDETVRSGALRGIWRTSGDIKGFEGALETLVPFLIEGTFGDRTIAIDTLGRLGKPAVPVLVEQLQDKNAAVCARSAAALGRMGADAKKAVPALTDLVFRGKFVGARPYPVKTAISAIGMIEPEKLNDLFARVKEQKDDTVRLHAYQALYVPLGNKETTSLPAKMALPHLIDATKDSSASIRLLAVQGIGSYGAEAQGALPVLKSLTNDADAKVRNAAIQAQTRLRAK